MNGNFEQLELNQLGRFLVISAVTIAVVIMAVFFFFNINEDKAQELSVAYIIFDEPMEPKVLISQLPTNKSVTSFDELIEFQEQIFESQELKSLGPTRPTVLLDVPFTAQAPFSEWSDPRQDYGCEESSLIMVWHYINDKPLSKTVAKQQITAMSDWELANYGEFRDSSAKDTVERFKKYFNHESVRLVYDITIEDIKHELAQGRPVIVPVNGQLLDNPYYTPPGPIQHMLVVIGFDETSQQFITNDPGTRRGAGMRYAYTNFARSLQDYETGHNEPIIVVRSAMIVVEPR